MSLKIFITHRDHYSWDLHTKQWSVSDIWQKPLHFLFLVMIIWKRQILCSFPIAICMLLFYLLWAKFISYPCSLKNMELIRLEFSLVNISTILVNCCFLSVFWTVFQERKKGKVFLYIFLMTLAARTALQYRCQYLVLYYLQLSKTVDCCVTAYLKK